MRALTAYVLLTSPVKFPAENTDPVLPLLDFTRQILEKLAGYPWLYLQPAMNGRVALQPDNWKDYTAARSDTL